jgi:hypothetical protein
MKKILFSIPDPCHENTGDFTIDGGTMSILSRVTEVKLWSAIRQMIDSVFANISIFPNPARRNAVIMIKTNKVSEGSYLASVFDNEGTVVQISSVSLQRKTEEVELPIGNVARVIFFTSPE